MKLASLLSLDQIILDMKAAEHWSAIVELVDHLVETQRLPLALRTHLLVLLQKPLPFVRMLTFRVCVTSSSKS